MVLVGQLLETSGIGRWMAGWNDSARARALQEESNLRYAGAALILLVGIYKSLGYCI